MIAFENSVETFCITGSNPSSYRQLMLNMLKFYTPITDSTISHFKELTIERLSLAMNSPMSLG